jgi:hypothetical protein
MTRRRYLLLGLLTACVVLGVSLWLLWPRSAINEDNYARIEVGMALDEVEAILGGPARDESTGPLVSRARTDDDDMGWFDVEFFQFSYDWRVPLESRSPRHWRSDRLLIRVEVDPQGRVAAKDSLAVRRMDESPLAMLRRWLGL